MLSKVFRCEVVELLHDGRRSTVYRARRAADGAPVVIKLAKGGDSGRLRAQHRELETLRFLRGVEGVIGAFSLEREGGDSGLLLEDFGARSLSDLGVAGALDPDDFLSLALKMVDVIDQVHRASVVHRDVNTANFVMNPKDGRLKLVDFARANMLVQEPTSRPVFGGLEGTLAYISPEQTGRMNRAVDHRADYYSLGVTLFELATGALPFASADPLELVHAHVAKKPPAPREMRSSISPVLSEIILKLLAKDADDRYQSAAWLRHDLERCRSDIGRTTEQAPSVRGDRFRWPERIYGRQGEVARLTELVDRVCRGSACLVSLEGAAGIGKSALVRELLLPVDVRDGYFAAGQSDPHVDAGPYAGLGQVLEALASRLLGEPADRLAEWRHRINASLLNTGQILVDLCPLLERVIGPQPSVPPLPPLESRTRLEQSLGLFFDVLATGGHPLCLFFDDMQWEGRDSLQLLREIMLGAHKLPMLVIVAFRDNEVGPDHPLRAMIDDVEKDGAPVERFTLDPLGPAAVKELLRDALSIKYDEPSTLTEIVFRRTGGNPLFVRAFLAAVLGESLIARGDGGQAGDLDLLREWRPNGDVLDLFTHQISRLPAASRNALALGACLGRRFERSRLEEVLGGDIRSDLAFAVTADLIFAVAPSSPEAAPSSQEEERYAFTHGLVREAVLATLGEEARAALHLRLGTRFSENGAEGARSPYIFEIMGHRNRAVALFPQSQQRLLLAQENEAAARVALARAAGAKALELAHAGLSVLGESARQRGEALALDLLLAAAEGAFLSADDEALEWAAEEILAHAHDPLDRSAIHRLRGQAHEARARTADAARCYLDGLRQLGITIVERPSAEQVTDEQRETAGALSGKSLDDLLALPECDDARARAAMELLGKLVLVTHGDGSGLFPVAVCRLVRLSLLFGNTAASANGYAFYGLLLSRDGQVDRAYRFGRLALDWAVRAGERDALARVYLHANDHLLHWKVPLAELAASFRMAHQYALEAANGLYAARSAVALCMCRFLAGDDLGRLLAEMERHREVIVRFRQPELQVSHEMLMQTIINLRADPADAITLSGPIYDERSRPAVETAARGAGITYLLTKICLSYVLGEHTAGLGYADALRPFIESAATSFVAMPAVYFDSLSRLACHEAATPEVREKLLDQVRQNQRRLTTWLPHNRRALEHKVRLIEAELLRVKGENDAARQLFAEAVELASASGSTHEEAVTAEVAARFSMALADGGMARSYLRTAHRAYLRWGAITKAKALERLYRFLLPGGNVGARALSALPHNQQELDILDMVSVLNASRVISSEIKLDRLLNRLMTLLIESGGARTGYLLVEKAGRWVVEAGQSADRGVLTTLESVPMGELSSKGHPPLAESVVLHVARTGERVLLDDAAAPGRFAQDPYIAEHGSGSILCFPLKRQRELLAIAYLENGLARNTFTVNSVRLLEMLSTQAVISLENASLYDRLEQKVEARTREIKEKNDELAKALARMTEMQERLVTQEKLAALGALTAGIAHEIKNPLNFVTNFAEVSGTLAEEIDARVRSELSHLPAEVGAELAELLGDLQQTVKKISEHGTRASGIVTGMALHARGSSGGRTTADLNALLAQSLTLSSPGPRRERGADISVTAQYDARLGPIEMVVQDISRVFVNLLENARHAVEEKRKRVGPTFQALLSVSTKDCGGHAEIRIRDNGMGIARASLDRIFLPFFTTKAPGDGTGLGLSISHEIIVRGHGGELRVESVEGEFAEFIIRLPKQRETVSAASSSSR